MPIGLGPNIVMPPLQSNLPPPGINLGLGQLGPLGPMGGFPPGPIGLKPPTGMHQGPPGFVPPPTNVRERIKHLIKDKNNIISLPQDSSKRLLSEPLKFLLE